jgi:hypothetical protein
MIVDNIQTAKYQQNIRLSARVIWEDCSRPTETIYFETDQRYSDVLSDNANAFLLSTAIPAMHYGEKRLYMDLEVCPDLKSGVSVVQDWFRYWYGKNGSEKLNIDVKLQKKQKNSSRQKHAGFFFSGGIDSYAVLCANREDFAPQHPGYIKDGIVIFGLELEERKQFDHLLKMLSKTAESFKVTMIPVFTNIYLIYRQEDKVNHFTFWNDKFHSAALTSVAHVLDKRLHTVSLGSTHDIPNLIPHGTHPVIEPNYSSSLLRVKLEGVNLSRFEKTKLIAKYPSALDNLRVCNCAWKSNTHGLNCGVCNKCVRTTLALEALGKLKDNKSFHYDHLDCKTVKKAFRNLNEVSSRFLLELVDPLKAAGRDDLALTVKEHWENYQRKKNGHQNRKKFFWSFKSLIKKNLSKIQERTLT